jgi:hypothetical protein
MDKETVKRLMIKAGLRTQWQVFCAEQEEAHAAFAQACCDWQKENSDHYDALIKIQQWANAYPLEVFPEPDFKKTAQVLKENGMTIDAISASNMRHVLSGIKDIVADAIRTKDSP